MTRADLARRLDAIPDPRKRAAAIAEAARIYAVPKPDPLLDQARKWAEEGDPEKCLRELFGYRLDGDAETRRLVYLLETKPKVLAIGAHDRRKTWIGGAMMFGWHWYVGGSVLGADDKPKGAILALVANKLSQTLKTSWAAIRRHAENAAANAHPIAGWEDAQKLSAPRLDGSLWRIHPQLWYIQAESFQAPAAKAGASTVHSGAGLKHPNAIHVWIEEAATLRREMFRTIQGWSFLLRRFGALNPYDAAGEAYDLSESGSWATATSSYLNAPDVLNRTQTIPGGANHLKIEEEMRSPIEVRCLGKAGEVEPDGARGDFAYALPPPEMEEKCGPRADGIPGHPDAEPMIWRPSGEFQAGRLGQFPAQIEGKVFWAGPWREAEELRYQLDAAPKLKRPGIELGALPDHDLVNWFDVVGIDTAEGGPDRIVCLGRKGPSASELWRRYMVELRPPAPSRDLRVATPRAKDHKTALAMALRCGICGGQGCRYCWEGIRWIYYGDPVEIPKTNDAKAVAQAVVDTYGTRPIFRLDSSAGGYWLEVPLRNLGCERVQVVPFSGKPPEGLDGQRLYRNMRAAMYGLISYVLHLGAVAMTDSAAVRAGCRPLQWEPVDREGSAMVYKLQDKTEIKASIGGLSPDEADALALTEGDYGVASAETGRLGAWL